MTTNFFTKEYIITSVTIIFLTILASTHIIDYEEIFLQIIAPHPHIPDAYGEEYILHGVWYVEERTSKIKWAPVITIEGKAIEEFCGSRHAGCVIEYNNQVSIVVNDPFGFNIKGCNHLTHEYHHLAGYSEQEIPWCDDLEIPDWLEKRNNELQFRGV